MQSVSESVIEVMGCVSARVTRRSVIVGPEAFQGGQSECGTEEIS